MGGKRGTPEERYWRKVVRTDGCWGWTGKPAPNGYAILSITGARSQQAHRFSWELHNGPIPAEMQVGHRCHDEDAGCVGLGAACPHRRCTRPDHLYLQTPQQNSAAGHGPGIAYAHYNAVKTHCKRGHEFTPANIVRDRRDGRRACRTCRNIAQLARYHARKKGLS